MSIKTYRDLKIWQKSMELVKDIYLLLSLYPDSEKFNLQTQIKRAAVSIPSNIAEGFGRNTNKDFQRFLYFSLGSIFEIQTQILISFEQGFIDKSSFQEIYEKTREIERMLSSFIESNRKLINA
jgi:four helix bundle protein